MAYFPHAFQKLLVATNATPFRDGDDTGAVAGAIATTALLAGQIGIINAKTNKVLDLNAAPSYANLPLVYLAQGSFHTNDKIGPFHGGYTETVKSKGINPKYVSGFYYAAPKAPVQNIIVVKPAANCEAIACDTTYRLRVDVKGSPALRFLTHNAYLTVDAYTGCCDTSNSNVDPLIVLLQWKEQLAASPIMSQFVSPKVWNSAASTTGSATAATNLTVASGTGVAAGQKVVGAGIPNNTFVKSTYTSGTTVPLADAAGADVTVTVAAATPVKFYSEVTTAFSAYTPDGTPDTNDAFLELTAAYADTTFGNCSFQPTDFYELQPLQLVAAVVDDMDQPCATKCFGASSTLNSTVTSTMSTVFVTNATTGGIFETQATAQGNGFGETIVRELILSNRYQQEPWNNDPRLREVLDDTVFSAGISRSSRYGAYYILHSVPRKSNPSGTMDADQYLVKIVVTGANTTFSNFVNAWLAAGGSEVSLQTV
jgi:hypothetical protein